MVNARPTPTQEAGVSPSNKLNRTRFNNTCVSELHIWNTVDNDSNNYGHQLTWKSSQPLT